MLKIERREFLKIAAATSAGAVISLYTSDLRDVFTQAIVEKRRIIWLQGSSDSGCTISLLQGVNPDLVDAITNFRLSIDFHSNLIIPSGDDVTEILQNTKNDIIPLDLLIIEGAIPQGNYCTLGESNGKPIPIEEWVTTLAIKAKNILAVGTCAAHGGIPGANPNPTMSRSVSQVLSQLTNHGKNIINIPGCPPHPDWIILSLAALMSGETIQLDNLNRPIAFFGGEEERIHEHCLLEEQSDDTHATELGQEPLYCLRKLGCRAKESEVIADCTERLWNDRTNVCMYAGAPCIGCVAPTFPDGMSPFFKNLVSESDNHEDREEDDAHNNREENDDRHKKNRKKDEHKDREEEAYTTERKKYDLESRDDDDDHDKKDGKKGRGVGEEYDDD